jgi:hypothetical protein
VCITNEDIDGACHGIGGVMRLFVSTRTRAGQRCLKAGSHHQREQQFVDGIGSSDAKRHGICNFFRQGELVAHLLSSEQSLELVTELVDDRVPTPGWRRRGHTQPVRIC